MRSLSFWRAQPAANEHIAALIQALGLSDTLGAFLAGVLLAETKYRYAEERLRLAFVVLSLPASDAAS
eukprot:scaffold145645_cov32-Tisochrysis_lutea.AAC.5